jgi:hypothetical protein
MVAMPKACTAKCAYEQYQQCGAGWTPEDENLFDANYTDLTDPALSLDSATVQALLASDGSGPAPVFVSPPSPSAAPARTPAVWELALGAAAFVAALL